MRVRDLIAISLGACAVYALAAACGASSRSFGGPDDAGGDVASARDVVHVIVDALTDPVPTAEAAPGDAPDSIPDASADSAAQAPQVNVEPCNVSFPGGYIAAVHAYPGKTVQDLSALRTVSHIATGTTLMLPPHEYIQNAAYLAPGSAAVMCGVSGNLSYDSVTFILP